MADGRDHGDSRGGDGAGDALGVKGGQIFERPAASGNDDGVDEGMASRAGGIEAGDGGFNLNGGGLALHAGGAEQDVEAGMAAAGDVEEIADDSA